MRKSKTQVSNSISTRKINRTAMFLFLWGIINGDDADEGSVRDNGDDDNYNNYHGL